MSILETSYVLYSCTHCLSSSLVGHVSTPWQVVTTYSVPTDSTPGCGSDGVEFKDIYIPILGFQRGQTLVIKKQSTDYIFNGNCFFQNAADFSYSTKAYS